MWDQDKLRIQPLDDKATYGLWKILVIAACSAKYLSDLFTEETAKETSMHKAKFIEVQRQASNIIVLALSG